LDELFHRRHEEQFAQPLSLPGLRDSKANQLHTRDFSRQPARDFGRQLLRRSWQVFKVK
jgi:hypothetical protein